MSNILVTGGNGFVGSHLVNALVQHEQHRVVVIDLYPSPYNDFPSDAIFIQADLADYALIRRIIEDHNIAVVYHVAWATIHETSLKDPAADIHVNLLPTVKLLEACRDTEVKRVIYLSSGGTVYGIPQSLPIEEGHPTNPICAYGVTKLAVEKYLYMYAYLYGLDTIIFRPSVLYGPRQNPHRRQGAITVFLYQALRGHPTTIWGDGKARRDYLYIDDMVAALLDALTLPYGNHPIFNLGGKQAYTLIQLVEEIRETLGVKIDVRYQDARKFDVPELHLDCRNAAEHLHWAPIVSLPEGVLKTAEWLEKWEK
ncbi:MAG: NAD-dependent epimerase/dehydratase family protein [bacterium]|nr:NAD-dependent epimerase/dehydratase family protein [bacterium]